MNVNQLKAPPTDLSLYCEAPERDSKEKTEANLRRLINQATTNIIAKGFAFELIHNLEQALKENGYDVFFVPVGGSATIADFYLRKFQDTNPS